MSRERALGIAGGGLVVLALTLAAGLFFKDLLPLPQPRRYLAGDFAILFYTAFRYVAEEVGAGRLPHWTPYVAVGYPLLADIQTAVFYPPIRLLTLVSGPPSYLALELYAIAHYVLAGLGMLALGRQVGLPLLAASLGAVALMFSGFFWGHAAHLGIIQAAAWLPWLLAAHARALVTRSPTWRIAAGGLLALVVLGGHPQVAFYAGVALGLSSLTMLQSRWRGADWWTRLRIPATTAVVVLLGLGLAAPQLLPTLGMARSASRWTPSAEFLAIDTLPLEQLLTLLVPFAYFATDRFQSADEFVIYVGTGTLLLAAAGVVLRRDVWSRYFALLVIVGLALALGPLIPGYLEVVRRVPLLGAFRASARATLLTALGAAGLAALGLDAWRRALQSGDARRRVTALCWGWRAALGLALAGYIAIRLAGVPAWSEPLATRFPELYARFVGLFVAQVAVLELGRAGWLRPRPAQLLTIGLLLVDLVHPHRAAMWSHSSPAIAWTRNDIVRELQAEPGRQRVRSEGWLHRRGRDFEANAGLVDRLEILSHDTQLATDRYDDFSQALTDPVRHAPLLDLANVRYLVLNEHDSRLRNQPKHRPPRLLPGDERRYDLRGLLDGTIGRLTVVAEPEAGPISEDPLRLTLSPTGERLDLCLGCASTGAGTAGHATRVAADEDRAVLASATLTPRQSAREVRVRNRLPYPIALRQLRLDEVDLYALGRRYHQLGPNLWENGEALPRAFLVEELLVVPEVERILPTLLRIDPRRTAVVETTPACQPSLRVGDPSAEDVALVDYSPTLVRLRLRSEGPAFLILADAHGKEWRARVDGRRAPIYNANLLFRGVCVPGGEHEVEFRYEPYAFRRGVVIALVAGLGAMATLVVGRWRRR